ncbi:MAG: hypothetical protein IJU86_01645, partial [Firmicutes bacterium]|nr:hypothetical protein [Bacillota bacterium]
MREEFFKRFTALTLASALVLSGLAIPSLSVNVLADSTNKISNNIKVSSRTLLCEPGATLPTIKGSQTTVEHVASGSYLNIKLDDKVEDGAKFKLALSNAWFAFQDFGEYIDVNTGSGSPFDLTKGNMKDDKTYQRVDTKDDTKFEYELTVDDNDYATVTVLRDFGPNEIIKIPMIVRLDKDLTSGSASVQVVANESGISGSTKLVFASVDKGSTKASVKNIQTGKNKIYINELLIQENVAGSMKIDRDDDGFYLELPSGYRFMKEKGFEVKGTNIGFTSPDADLKNDSRRLEVTFDKDNFTPSTSSTGRIKITGLSIVPKYESDNITKEDITIDIGNIGSSNMVTEQSFKAGIRADYSVGFKTNGTVPTILNGFYDTSNSNEKTKSAKLTVAEDSVGSLIDGGDLKLTVSDRAKISAVKIENKDNIKESINGPHNLGDNENGVDVRESQVILRGLNHLGSLNDSNNKAKFDITFYLSVESGYEGDITVEASGDALRNSSAENQKIVIAKAVNPITVDVKTTYFKPGTTTELEDIVLTEQKVGNKNYSAFEENKIIAFGFKNNNNYLSIVETPTVSVENGSVKDIKVNNSNRNGSLLSFKIKEASSGNKVSRITISGLKVASNSSTPQGTYDLVVGGSAIAGNSTAVTKDEANKALFSTDGITVAKLQNGGTISLKITIGDKIAVVNGKNVEMQVAPFIDPATGTTYMQVSDIVKATGMNCSFFDNAIHKLEGMKQNLFVTFGSRTFERNSSSVRIYGETIPETM